MENNKLYPKTKNVQKLHIMMLGSLDSRKDIGIWQITQNYVVLKKERRKISDK